MIQTTDTVSDKHKTFVKLLAIIVTIIYLLMLPFLFGFACCSIMVFDKPNLSTFFGSAIIFTFFSIPFSIIPTVYFIWSNYLKERHKKTCFFCAVPIITFVIAVLVVTGLTEMNDFFFPIN